MSKLFVYISLVLIMMIWGFNVIAIKILVEHFSPVMLTSFRIFAAGIVVILILLFMGQLRKMNLSHLHSMKRWEFLTISIEEASARKKAVSFHSMNSSEAFLMGPVSNIGITPMGRSNPSTTSCLRNP